MLQGGIANAGASLGFCLANINNYKNSKDFITDFGKIATINGSITAIVAIIPVFGTLLLIGGLGYTTLSLYNNKE